MPIAHTKTPQNVRDHYRTPANIVAWAVARYGCNIDLAAAVDNKWFPHFFSASPSSDPGYQGNGLESAWARYSRDVGWCNPPYSNIKPWLMKATNEALAGFNSVFLVPTFNGEKWAVWAMLAREIIFIQGRISFLRHDTGKPLAGNTRGSMLCVFGPHNQSSPSISYRPLAMLK